MDCTKQFLSDVNESSFMGVVTKGKIRRLLDGKKVIKKQKSKKRKPSGKYFLFITGNYHFIGPKKQIEPVAKVFLRTGATHYLSPIYYRRFKELLGDPKYIDIRNTGWQI